MEGPTFYQLPCTVCLGLCEECHACAPRDWLYGFAADCLWSRHGLDAAKAQLTYLGIGARCKVSV